MNRERRTRKAIALILVFAMCLTMISQNVYAVGEIAETATEKSVTQEKKESPEVTTEKKTETSETTTEKKVATSEATAEKKDGTGLKAVVSGLDDGDKTFKSTDTTDETTGNPKMPVSITKDNQGKEVLNQGSVGVQTTTFVNTLKKDTPTTEEKPKDTTTTADTSKVTKTEEKPKDKNGSEDGNKSWK